MNGPFHLPVTMFQVAVAFAAVIGVVLYRISILAAFYACSNKLVTNYALILTNITAASINLLFIVVMNVVGFLSPLFKALYISLDFPFILNL